MNDVIISQLRGFLSVYGPLSVGDISRITGISTGDVTASLHILQVEGYKFGIYPTIFDATKALKTAQDAPEAAETGIGSTTEAESGTGQAGPFYFDPANVAIDSVVHLAKHYSVALNKLVEQKAQADALREELYFLHDRASRIDQLQADSDAYHALKEKLRGVLDE